MSLPRLPQQMLNLTSLLSHPNNGALSLIAGSNSREWQEVTVEEQQKSSGSGLLISLEQFPRTAWQQDSLLRRVRDRGYLALAIQGAAYAEPGARVLAERLGLTLLEVTRPVELARACWQLQQARDSLTLDYVRKVAQAFEYPAAHLPDLLGHLSAAIGHGIALLDSSTVIHQLGGMFDVALHKAIDFAPWISTARVGDTAAATVRVDSTTRSGLRLAVFEKGISDHHLRALSTVAEIMMPAVAARILIDELAVLNDASASADLLRDFLERRGTGDADLRRRMTEHGWRTSGYHLGFQFTPRGPVDPIALLRALSQELSTVSIEAHAVLASKSVLCWLSVAEPPRAEEVENYASTLHEIHQRLRTTRDVALGIGSLQSGESGLWRTLTEAGDAAKLASSRSSSGYLVRVDSLGLEQLLLAWTGSDTFVPAAESLLSPLLQNAPELLDTLASYLDHESNIQATASALGLHRNTISLRIQRTQELLGVDLSLPEARLALHLACRAVTESH